MTNEEILEGNRLIAEFVGAEWKQDDYKDWGFFFFNADTLFPDWNKMRSIESLKYHTSWDWLMPVVEKIERTNGVRFLIKPFACEIILFGKSEINEAAETKIESVWLAVVEFIKWHNEQANESRTTN